jgi:hypothetical protein
MNPTLTAEDLLRSDVPEQVLAFLASRSKQSVRQLSAPASEVFKGIREAVDQLILSAIETRTENEFKAAFKAAFPKYVGITLALSAFSNAVVPEDTINRMARESICELEAEFRDKALPAFGSEIKDQLMFTVWTLRKISDLLIQIAATKPDDSCRERDKECCEHFLGTALQAKFALDCFSMALHLNRPIYPEVMEALKDGLRAMVNAYAWARRGAALRAPAVESTSESDVSTEEDNELLRSSMQDMAFMLDGEESPRPLDGD